MLLGASATLLSGIRQWIGQVPIALIVFEVRIRVEERLKVMAFPDDCHRYRRRVPSVVPGP